MPLGRAIRKVRLGAALTQAGLAHRLGITQSTVSKWEDDDKDGTPSLDEIARTEDVCHRDRGTIYRLMGYVKDPKTTREAIRGDPLLTRQQANFIISVYDSVLADLAELDAASNARAEPVARKTRRK